MSNPSSPRAPQPQYIAPNSPKKYENLAFVLNFYKKKFLDTDRFFIY